MPYPCNATHKEPFIRRRRDEVITIGDHWSRRPGHRSSFLVNLHSLLPLGTELRAALVQAASLGC